MEQMASLDLETTFEFVEIPRWVKCLHSGEKPGMPACTSNSSPVVQVETGSSLELADWPASPAESASWLPMGDLASESKVVASQL